VLRIVSATSLASFLSLALLDAQSTFNELADRARVALEADHVADAIDLYGRATALRPEWAEGWWHLGTLLYDNGRFGESREAFARFVGVEKAAGPGFGMLGLCEFQLKQYQRALAALDRARRLGLGPNPEFVRRVVYTTAILHNRFGRSEVAIHLLTLVASQAAAANGGNAKTVLDDAELINAIGLAALRMHRLLPEVPPAKLPLIRQAGRAWALFELKDWVPAEREFQELLSAYSSQRGVHYMNGLFFLKTHPEQAIAQFEKEIALSPNDASPRIQIALESLRLGANEEARRYASEAVKLEPGNFAAHVILSRAWLALDDVSRAVEEAKAAVKLAPESPDAHLALSRSYAQAKRTAEAERERIEFERLQALVEKTGT
jgi:tetratricopeptide (TPR) repeat protein